MGNIWVLSQGKPESVWTRSFNRANATESNSSNLHEYVGRYIQNMPTKIEAWINEIPATQNSKTYIPCIVSDHTQKYYTKIIATLYIAQILVSGRLKNLKALFSAQRHRGVEVSEMAERQSGILWTNPYTKHLLICKWEGSMDGFVLTKSYGLRLVMACRNSSQVEIERPTLYQWTRRPWDRWLVPGSVALWFLSDTNIAKLRNYVRTTRL